MEMPVRVDNIENKIESRELTGDVLRAKDNETDFRIQQIRNFYEDSIAKCNAQLSSINAEAYAYKMQRNEILESDACQRKTVAELEMKLEAEKQKNEKLLTTLQKDLQETKKNLDTARDSHAKSMAILIKSREDYTNLSKENIQNASKLIKMYDHARTLIRTLYWYVVKTRENTNLPEELNAKIKEGLKLFSGDNDNETTVIIRELLMWVTSAPETYVESILNDLVENSLEYADSPDGIENTDASTIFIKGLDDLNLNKENNVDTHDSHYDDILINGEKVMTDGNQENTKKSENLESEKDFI